MSKLYVFGIGGTGSRVLKSLTMLLASGVKCKADTIVPHHHRPGRLRCRQDQDHRPDEPIHGHP